MYSFLGGGFRNANGLFCGVHVLYFSNTSSAYDIDIGCHFIVIGIVLMLVIYAIHYLAVHLIMVLIMEGCVHFYLMKLIVAVHGMLVVYLL